MSTKRPLDNLDADIRDHIERETTENIARGMSPADARMAALRKFGNVTRVMEDTRYIWRRVWLEQLLQDIRYGLRFLGRNPRFTAIVVLTMALGIGVNTAVFSVVNTVLLKPVSYPNPDRLVWLGDYDANIHRDMVSTQDYEAWRTEAKSYTGMASFGYQQAAISTPHGLSQTTAVYVAGDFWSLTGGRAAAGHLFSDSDQDSLVLSRELFDRDFNSDPRTIGQSVTVNGRQVLITGVLPKGFRFHLPMWWTSQHPEPVESYLAPPPLRERRMMGTQVFGALKPGVSRGQAEAELRLLEDRLRAQPGAPPYKPYIHVDLLQDQLVGSSRTALLVLLAAGVFVLLIATVNVANLLLARASLRCREIAIRAAVGAGRLRIIRQLLVESILQAIAGGAAGLLLARAATATLVRISPYAVPRLAETAIDWRVLAFTLAISLITGLLFGAGAAVALCGPNLHDALKSGARASTGTAGLRVRRVLVAFELAMAIVLLTGAGLMLKSYSRMNAHPAGFDPAEVISMKIRLAGARYRAKPDQIAYMRKVLERLEQAPGLKSAGLSRWLLFGGVPAFPSDTNPSRQHVVRINAASGGYLQAMGMSLRKGRWLTATDTASDAALLNESMAREVFGTADPVGRRFTAAGPLTVVGVVSDVKYSKLDAAAVPEIFIPLERAPMLMGAELAARASASPAAIIPALRELISDIDPDQAIYDVKTLDDALAQSIAPRRFNLFLLDGFALSALLLAIVGIYGVMSYSVAERTREIGVRMALGARRTQVASLVLRDAILPVIAGILAGLVATWSLTRIMATLLYDVKPADPPTFAAVAALLSLTAIAACIGPAWKAASIDPTVTLRYE
jgi:putative ABC transport system permease protein